MRASLRFILALTVVAACGVGAFFGYMRIAQIFWPLHVYSTIGEEGRRIAGAGLSGLFGLAFGNFVVLRALRVR